MYGSVSRGRNDTSRSNHVVRAVYCPSQMKLSVRLEQLDIKVANVEMRSMLFEQN